MNNTFACTLSTRAWYASICLSSFLRAASVFSLTATRGTPCCSKEVNFQPTSASLLDTHTHFPNDLYLFVGCYVWQYSLACVMPQRDAQSWRQHFRLSDNQHPNKIRTRHRRFFESNQDVQVGPFSVTLKARYPVRTFFKNLSFRFSLHRKSSQKSKHFHIPSQPIKHSSKRRGSSTSYRSIHSESVSNHYGFNSR